jgi:hypothetical protein
MPPKGITQEEFERIYLEPAKGTKKATAWLDEDVVESRCVNMRLREERVVTFIEHCEFLSFGSFCGVARALQALGLKRLTYPFDWVRTSVPCTVACLQRDFVDFCTSSFSGSSPEANPAPGVQLRGGAMWGGSFWHHDPHNAKVQQDFARRIDRLKGKLEVAPDVRRVVCVSLNSLADLAAIPLLRQLVEKLLPMAEIFMLVFIDNQPAAGLIRVACDDRKTLFHLIHQDLFEDRGRTWSEQRHVEAYAVGIATALQFWSGNETGDKILDVESYTHLYACCFNFDGSNPAEKQYWPLRVPNEQPPEILCISQTDKQEAVLHPPGNTEEASPGSVKEVSLVKKVSPVVHAMGNSREMDQAAQTTSPWSNGNATGLLAKFDRNAISQEISPSTQAQSPWSAGNGKEEVYTNFDWSRAAACEVSPKVQVRSPWSAGNAEGLLLKFERPGPGTLSVPASSQQNSPLKPSSPECIGGSSELRLEELRQSVLDCLGTLEVKFASYQAARQQLDDPILQQLREAKVKERQLYGVGVSPSASFPQNGLAKLP